MSRFSVGVTPSMVLPLLVVLASCRSASVSSTNVARQALQRDEMRLAAAPAPPGMNDAQPAPKEFSLIPVYFATRRSVDRGNAEPERYYGVGDDTLKYGVASVTIPVRRRPGEDDGRGLCRYLPGSLKCTKTPANSVLVNEVDPVSSDVWLARLATAVDSGGVPADVLVYVHGFNNGFADAMHRAAQVSFDAGFNGVTVTFDWASRNALGSYMVDEATAERSVPDFKQFLRRVADSTHARRIAVIAHSMGTRLVSYALRDMTFANRTPGLAQIVFAASDIDSATFVQQYAAPVAQRARLVTLYASSKDKAIAASKTIVHGAPRVGSGPPSVILSNPIDYVDASAVDTDLIGHGYFAENMQLINDLFLVLRHGLPAQDRNLEPIPIAGGTYYRLR
jgi:esterase/lipase superfamily enzyme